jgi:class 3 adenylate cyclase/tetratricopeptide (TPR) repeat protein
MATCPSCREENPDRFRLCGFCGTPLAPALPSQEVRKTVTIVFSDLKGSTVLGETLESESLRDVMTRYFDEMRRVLEEHGGTIEKFIGDAVMAVFGLPRLHEDDALRAVRAAYGMQRALAALNEELERGWGVRLENRTGVNTGEVVAGDPTAGQRLVTGDAVNTAARLEQAAPASQVLLGELTYRLVRDAVEVEPVEPLSLKGKAEPVPAYRLLAVHGEHGYTRRHDALLIGREPELDALGTAFDEAVAERQCRLVTVIADAGVGKSRLVDAFATSISADAAVHRGRCLPYGKGITFWPFAEVVRDAAGIAETDPIESARAKLSLCVPGPDREAVVDRVAAAIGLSRDTFPIEELFWGGRKLLAALADERPRVVVFDDVHWAEPTFLDFVEHVTESVDDAPLLLVCPTRPDLLEHRLEWGRRARSRQVELAPLSRRETELVLENLFGGIEVSEALRRQLVAGSEGNPLFVEQLVSMLIDRGDLRLEDGAWRATRELASLEVPPTIQALLAARLDHLGQEERAIIEPASVVGLVFARAALEQLVPDALRAKVPALLEGLAQKRLVRPQGVDGDAFRFNHILIRDAAYNGLLKRTRATLHERFVDWADDVNRDRDRETEFEEILAYHLEQAHRYLGELGPLDDHGREVGGRAAERLTSAGRRAFARGDMTAAVNLLGRAEALLTPADSRRLALLPDLSEALVDTGDFNRAQQVLDDGVAQATAVGDELAATRARLARLLVLYFGGDETSWADQVERETARALPVLQAAEDHAALARAWRLLASVHGRACQFEQEALAGRQAMTHARAAGDRRQELRSAAALAMSSVYGRAPIAAAIPECEQILEDARGDRRTEGLVLGSLARLYALRGEFARAREAYRRARQTLEDLGPNVLAASLSLDSHAVELLAGDPVAAENELRRDYEALDRMGEKYLLSTIAGLLAQALCAQGRFEEANRMCSVTASAAAEDDPQSQALWRSVRAKVLARRRDREKALELAQSAVDQLRETDALVWQADALVDLAETRLLLDDIVGAREAVSEATRLYELKGSEVAAERARALVAAHDVVPQGR